MFQTQAIALGLGNFLSLIIQEHFIDQAFRLAAAQNLRNFAGLHAAIGQILAVHFIIDAKCDPAHRPIHLPLQLGLAAEHRLGDHLPLIFKADKTCIGINHLYRNLEDNARFWADGQNGRIGGGAFLTERGQHDVENSLIAAQDIFERIIKMTAFIAGG